MDAHELTMVATLLRSRRWAALGTLHGGAPLVSWVAYAPEPGFGGLLLHLSRLAAHTTNLLADPRASLAVSEPEQEATDPQTLARITISGQATVIAADDSAFAVAKQCYLERLPDAAMLFTFPDFVLLRLVPQEARFVGGFARAYTLTPALLEQASQQTM